MDGLTGLAGFGLTTLLSFFIGWVVAGWVYTNYLYKYLKFDKTTTLWFAHYLGWALPFGMITSLLIDSGTLDLVMAGVLSIGYVIGLAISYGLFWVNLNIIFPRLGWKRTPIG